MGDEVATRVIKYGDDIRKSLMTVKPNISGVSGVDRSLGDKLRSLALNFGVKTALPMCFVKVKTTDIRFQFPQKSFVPLPLLDPREAEFFRENYQHCLLRAIEFTVVSLVPPGTPGKLGFGLYDTRMTCEKSSSLASFEFAASKRRFTFTVEPNYYVSTNEDLSALWCLIPKLINVPIELDSFPFHVCAKAAFAVTNELTCLPDIQNTIMVLTGPDVLSDNRTVDAYDMRSQSFSYGSDFAAAKRLRGSTSMRFDLDEQPSEEIEKSDLRPKFEAEPVKPQSNLTVANIRR